MSKVILITGASMGIGQATASQLVRAGHRVYGTSRHPLHTAVDFHPLVMDVNDDESVQVAVSEVLQREQRVDVLINNAGLGIVGALEEVPDEMIRRVFDTNVWGLLRVCRAVLPAMRQQGSGLIVNVSSVAGVMGLPYRGIYSASKAAVEMLTESLRLEVRPFGVQVCSILPGDVRTNINSNRLVATGPAHSPYRQSVSAINAQIRAEVRQADTPAYIAESIEKIINESSVAAHYVAAPPVQKLAVWLKRWLPSRWFEALIKRSYGLD
ncbi:MAG: SDR family oxidoreductase [Spirosomaceae bacterium]|jgi:NAD(P)-dependent dehydrogenase (short-subunit alcohol dehydrogenase family)|nr:SDR family oxidoreductase [Spirosomataceae bacterium]